MKNTMIKQYSNEDSIESKEIYIINVKKVN